MTATVTKAFKCVRPGDIYPTEFVAGDFVEGHLARIAVANGWAAVDEPAVVDDQPAVGSPADEAAPKARARRGRKS